MQVFLAESLAAASTTIGADGDRAERLTNLLALLLETRRPLTLHEIASELESQYPEGGQARRAAFERERRRCAKSVSRSRRKRSGGDRR